MEEEDEDKLLLSSLGIASANQEDIERKILSEAKSDRRLASELGGSSTEHDIDDNGDSSFPNQTSLYNRLCALEVEIQAVASSVENSKLIPECAGQSTDDKSIAEAKCSENITDPVQATSNDVQHALAKDRLQSLNQAKSKLLKQISKLRDYAPDNGTEQKQHKRLLAELVKENSKPKKKPRKADQSVKDSKLPFKVVSYEEDDDFDAVLDGASAGFMETERDKLVRKGILTPFHKLKGFERCIQQPESSNRLYTHEEDPVDSLAAASIAKAAQSMSEFARARPTLKLLNAEDLPGLDAPTRPFQRLKTPLKRPGSPTSKEKRKVKWKKRPLPDKRWRNADAKKEQLMDEREEDAKGDSNASDVEAETQEGEFEDEPSVVLDGGLKIPGAIYAQLFDYQKVGVQWLWELHCQRAGGIIGDEMGLGKTIQVIAFLGALHFSKLYKPSIVICPVTLLQQWQREVRKWYPEFRVEILHDSAHTSNRLAKSKSDESDYDSEASSDNDTEVHPTKSLKKWDIMIDRVVKSEKGLLLTTYEQLRIMGENLLKIEWGYAVLDEGHRIRNPNAEITLVCKQLQTVHRIIMTGAPIQNKLSELWSLFDFVFPGKLGVLPVFESEFAVPIKVGGYANATPLQVSTAYRCAVVLRDLVMPYLLRRMKSDVDAQLPKKTEHVLFCRLTSEQISLYRTFLASSDVEQIFDGSRNSLYGIDVMRKICNHPDLLEREHADQHPDYGNPERSGKMKVVSQVLKVWKEQGHRVLLFAQTQQMLDIIQTFLAVNGYNYRRMDGVTPVKQRMALIDEFNNSDEVFIFILTTKVGGLGTNLTGANRVIIYDPDWNPSTDMQARERAWRIGQKRDVTVYRLITRGTIEEKVYHRQIYKHFLSNKILKNPQQRRLFKARDMKDLFTLQDDQHDCSTETSNIFRQLVEEIKVDNQDTKELTSSVSTGPDSSAAQMNSSGLEASAPSTKGKEKIDQSIASKDEETNILQSLLDAHGFHSAMNHDDIMNAHDDDKLRLEEQASQVAQRAARALRESRILRSRESFAVPTWTGRAGAAGAPSSGRNRFGSTVNARLVTPPRPTEGSTMRPPGFSAGNSNTKALSSAQLLAKIKGTQERAAGDALEQELDLASTSNHLGRIQKNGFSVKTPSKITIAQPEVMIRQLCTFIQKMGGYSDSSSITQHFKDRIQSTDLPLFKNLLREIASLEKDANGSRWVLKPDYR